MKPRRLFRAAALTQAELRRGETAGRWRLIERGVYGGGRGQPSPLDRALVPFVRRDSVVCGALAGALHGLDAVELERTQPKRRECDRVVLIDGWLRCTDGLQTLVDLAATLDDDRWEQALESALRKRLCTVADLAAALPELGQRRTPGTARIRRVLARRPAGAAATESLLETLMVQLARGVDGLPEPVRQYVVENRYGEFVRASTSRGPPSASSSFSTASITPSSRCTTPAARRRSWPPPDGCAVGSRGPGSFASPPRQLAGCATYGRRPFRATPRRVRRLWGATSGL